MVGCPVKLDTPPHAAGLKTPGSQWSRDPSSLPHPLGGGFIWPPENRPGFDEEQDLPLK